MTDAPTKKPRRHIATRPRLLVRSELDGRTSAAKVFDALVDNIVESDLGGRKAISNIEFGLVEGYVEGKILLGNLIARQGLGEKVNVSEYASIVSTMVRCASRLGLQRRQKDVTPSLSEYLETKAREREAST